PDAAHVVVGQGTHAEAVVLEGELQRVLPRRQRGRTFPADALQIDEIPDEHRLAFQDIEAVAAESSALPDDHAVGSSLWNVDVRLVGARAVEKAWGVAIRCSGDGA